MISVTLHGGLGDQFGHHYNLSVDTASEAMRAVAVQVAGFESAMLSGAWHFVRGPLEDGVSMDGEGLHANLGSCTELHVIPAVAGANNALMIVVGIVIFVAGFFSGGTAWSAYGPFMMAAGAGIALSGIIGMTMTPPASGTDGGQAGEEKGSFLFSGPTNTSKQGVAVPRGYGRVRVGSVVVSASITSVELGSQDTQEVGK